MRVAAPLLAALVALALPIQAGAVSGRAAQCEITVRGERIDGPCRFTPRQRGSFDVAMMDGRAMGGAISLALDITGSGVGEVRSVSTAGVRAQWGSVRRLDEDGACWRGADFTICVRAVGEPPAAGTPPSRAATAPEPSAADRARSFGARCHMGACDWYIQAPARETGQGSDAVPGRRIEVDERTARSEHAGDYPDHAPPGLSWSPERLELFCSTVRPAFREADGRWTTLPLPEIFGASEGISLRYLKACHAGAGDDPYEAVAGLGYRASPQAGRDFPNFDALVAP